MHSDVSYRRLSGREIFLILLFWTSLAALSSVNRLLDPRGFGFRVMSPAGPITLAFIEAWLWALATPLIFWLSSQFSTARSPWLVRIPLLIVTGIVISVALYALLGLAREQILDFPMRRNVPAFSPLRELGRFRFANQLIVYFAVLAAGFAREYFLRDQSRQREAAQLQAQLAKARLEALRMQINPHFLFNTLHAVSALVERDPSGVRRMIARLSELLRYTIDSHGTSEVPLREELDFLQRYVDIMEIRFQGRLQVVRSIAPDTLDALVPNLILQPIIENALEHGVSRLSGAGLVEISALRQGSRLVLAVRDNGPGLAEPQRNGIGLANTRERLEQLYGANAELTVTSAAEGGTVATIAVPFRTASDADV